MFYKVMGNRRRNRVIVQYFRQMGQNNGKPLQYASEQYFQRQIELYRWRADSVHNSHIPRVKFFSKIALLHRSKLQNLLQDQLDNLKYVDIRSISKLKEQTEFTEEEQIMTFQPFIATLEAFQECLQLQETLYVMQTLLSGYQSIFQKMKGFFVSPDCCFVNENGEVRAWINQNPTLNEFSQNYKEVSEAASIGQIVKVCDYLCGNHPLFLHFSRQLKFFTDRDMLHNLSFSAIRRFINGYLFTYKLILPTDLSQSIKKNERILSCKSSARRANSNFSELLEPNHDSNSYLSTKDNLMNRQQSKSQYSGGYSSMSNSNKSHQIRLSHVQNQQFYRPSQKPQRKLSNLDINTGEWRRQQLKKSQMLLKRSVQKSISSTFSKKQNNPVCQVTFTPKNAVRTRAHLQSTAGESFLRYSKDQSGLTVSKIVQNNSTAHLLEASHSKSRLKKSNIRNNIAFISTDSSSKQYGKIEKMQTQTHSKQPSFDQKSSSFFVSPNNERVDRNYFQRPMRSKIQTVSQSEVAEEDESYIQHNISTINQVFPSQVHIGQRKVSGLFQNKGLHMCESKGSFLSIENNSSASEYRGVLTRMGRSAKMVALPSNKRLQGYFRSQIQHHLTR